MARYHVTLEDAPTTTVEADDEDEAAALGVAALIAWLSDGGASYPATFNVEEEYVFDEGDSLYGGESFDANEDDLREEYGEGVKA